MAPRKESLIVKAGKPDDEIEIETPDTGDADIEVIPAAAEAATSLQDQLDEFKRLNEEATKRADAAEAARAADRKQFDAERRTTQTELTDTRLQTIGNALSANDLERKAAKARMTEAYNAGEFDKVSDIQDELSNLAVKRQRMEEGKNQIETQLENSKTATDPIDGYIATLKPRTQDWAKNHKDWIADPSKNQRVVQAHYVALDSGLAEESPEYFKFIEGKLGLGPAIREPEIEVDTQRQVDSERRPPAAPVSRSAPSGGRTNGSLEGRYKLTPQHAEAAQIAGVSHKEYLENMDPDKREALRVH